MSALPGTRFGPYEVISVLGAGGMGEVYRARDSRLERDVALKVLPAALTADPDRLARFRREAQVLASLNHPNIAGIYGLEEMRGGDPARPVDALVLELVEGPTLAERIAAGPLPFGEAREIAIQIAGALESAHEHGIVHRDLKPANVKVRPDGAVKVLDFGLAKALQPASDLHDIAASPTFTSPAMTAGGVILGTAAYMSPEQARGAHVDRRTDVWAFGCVLFEMLAGRHVFGQMNTVSDAIAAVLKSEPAWDALPADTPAHIRALLKRCLEKDPRRRLRDIGDAGLLLGEASDVAMPTSPAMAAPSTSWPRRSAWAAGVLVLAAVAAGSGWVARDFRAAPASPPLPLRLTVPLASPLAAGHVPGSFAVSPDDTKVVYAGRDGDQSSLYLQDLVSGEFKRLPETTGARSPAFSPDGRSIAFTSGATIKVLPLDGLPREIPGKEARAIEWQWSGLDHVLLAGHKGLLRLPTGGGSADAIVPLETGEALFTGVSELPDGAYVVAIRATTGMDDASSRVAVVAPGDAKRLVIAEQGASPRFVAARGSRTGHIVYARGGRLMAVPFDGARRAVLGSAVPVAENVAMRPNGDLAEYHVTSNGTLVFRQASLHELVWVDRGTQTVRPASANLRRFALPRLSPDGRRVAMEVQDSPHQIWMLDFERDLLTPLTTGENAAHNFAWSPDGTAIIYTLGNVKPPQLGWIRTDGSSSSGRIEIPKGAGGLVDDWSRDNRVLVTDWVPQARMAMSTFPLSSDTPPKPSGPVSAIASGSPGSLSPDGGWVTYCDCWDTSKRVHNAFIRHLQSGSEYQVSVQGGSEPAWGPGGRELFFRNGAKMMAVALTLDGSTAKIGPPQVLFEGDYLIWSTANYDVTADGQRFLMVRPNTSHLSSLAVRLHWISELEKLAPMRR